eukprot:CAMPEP_0181256862 /NCGR_PEP_ID=MMETSP1096-20121128/49941_1 /TAXON_ID=156174 ORGANISM="Chrysochromulina ericina, Strain CCMP281" /NCGR_SAMPLE_ID=MMETSP1096 /ASSEMBLY_ACC=CAM_ASM_000453 /LENGTH=35 /DNA_ID= /DNA_START= /DNA_END= /DNA_ORIENTATION=
MGQWRAQCSQRKRALQHPLGEFCNEHCPADRSAVA